MKTCFIAFAVVQSFVSSKPVAFALSRRDWLVSASSLLMSSMATSTSSTTSKNSTVHETSQQQHETPEELKDLEDDDNFEPVQIKQPSTINTASSYDAN